jgi:hypothetical protein
MTILVVLPPIPSARPDAKTAKNLAFLDKKRNGPEPAASGTVHASRDGNSSTDGPPG